MSARPTLGAISPCFIVRDLAESARFYQDALGFELRFQTPEHEPFFAILQRDGASVHLKEVARDVPPQPNPSRHAWMPFDAFVFTPDPDALAEELASRGTALHTPVQVRDDGLRGFEIRDHDGYGLFFGRPDA